MYICLKIRKFLKENPQYDLRNIIDAIRPKTQFFWHNLDQKNKRIFLKFLPYWNIHRHRAALSSMVIVKEFINSDQLKMIKGNINDLKLIKDKIIFTVKDKTYTTDCLVNCSGFEFDAKKYPLLNQMINDGLLQKDIFMCSSLNNSIHLLGGLNIGQDFESTSVPNLRVQIEEYFFPK